MARLIIGLLALSLFCIYTNAEESQNCGPNEELTPCGKSLEPKCPHLSKRSLNEIRTVNPADCVLECSCKKEFLRTNDGNCDKKCEVQSC